MSKTAYYLDFVTIPLLILWLLYLTPFSLSAFALGLFAWTFAEYVIHRFLFHRVPFFREPHDEHHDKPSGRTGVTSYQSFGIFVALSAMVMLHLIPGWGLAGFTTGYLFYIVIHHMYHHWYIPPSDGMYPGKMRHRMHHNGIEANFGVVTTFWDHVFGTYQAWTPNR